MQLVSLCDSYYQPSRCSATNAARNSATSNFWQHRLSHGNVCARGYAIALGVNLVNINPRAGYSPQHLPPGNAELYRTHQQPARTSRPRQDHHPGHGEPKPRTNAQAPSEIRNELKNTAETIRQLTKIAQQAVNTGVETRAAATIGKTIIETIRETTSKGCEYVKLNLTYPGHRSIYVDPAHYPIFIYSPYFIEARD